MNLLSKYCAFILCCLLIAACSGENKTPPNPANMPVPVNLYEVQLEKALYYDKFPGTIVAMMQVDLRAQVEGYVTGIFFTEGSFVNKGKKLYTIDSRKYQASSNQLEANVKVAEANLLQAQKDADRYTYLNQHEAVAKQTLDHAMTALQNAKQQVNAAKQALARAQTDVGYSTITAPFSGVIGISQVKLGNMVVPGQTILNTISTSDPMAVDILVNEKEIQRFIKLQNLKHNPADSLFTIQLPDNSIYSYTGRIHVIDRGVNPQTGSITIRLAFPNPSSALRTGMSCNLRVRNDDTTEQLIIPYKAVVEQMGEYFVYIAKDTVAEQRKVTLGPTIADQAIIKTGLEPGEKVITDGIQKLHDGSRITIGEQKK
jgi:membrane fusion protein (multidrug efflux system)